MFRLSSFGVHVRPYTRLSARLRTLEGKRRMSDSKAESVAEGRLRNGPSDPSEIRAMYDEWADGYEADLDAWEYRTPVDVAELLRTTQPDAANVLDVGCGTGRSGRALQAAGFTSVVGCDLSPQSLKHADATGAYTRTVEVNLQQLPLPFNDNSFDALTCVGVMTYVPDTEAILREFCRLVRTGGTIMFTHREDAWQERDCAGVTERLTTDRLWQTISVSEPLPYLPKNGEMGDIGVIVAAYCRIS